jgi:hypothetical protein
MFKKYIIGLVLIFLLVFNYGYAADTAMDDLTDGSASIATTWYGIGYNATTAYRFTLSSLFGLKIGTLTNTYLCTSDGTKINCTTAPTTYQIALTNPLELGGNYTPTGIWTWSSASWVNVPTLNQDTTGSAGTAYALATDPAACAALGLVTDIAANGTLTCGYAIGTDVQAYNAILDTVSTGGDNNTVFGKNNAGTYGFYANHTHDDSAAQFYSATASKGTRKLVQSSISDGILLTDTPVITGAVTWTNVSQGAGTYNRVFLETDNTFTGANTIGDGGDDQRIVSRINATNERWSGHTIYFAQCAATLAFGTPVYIQSTGKPGAADADAAATMPAIGLIVVASTDADTPCTVLTHGTITDTDWNFTTVGATIYTSETAGSVELDVANISDANDVVQVLGIALHADTLFVSPSLVTIVLE